MRKLFRKIHLWLSIPVGLVFCMLCVTGALLVFETEISDAYYADARQIETQPGLTPLAEDTLKAAVFRCLGEERPIRRIQPSDKADEAWTMSFVKPRGSAVFVNPYNGEIVGEAGRLEFFATVMSLHRWLLDAPLDGNSTGRRVIGWCTLASFFIVVSGFVIWLPAAGRRFVTFIKIDCRSGKAFWHSLHTAGGFWTLAIMLLVILTGLTWSFEWWHDVATSVTGNMHYAPIHTGAWLGIVGKLLWFASALIGATLPLTGYWMWLHRIMRRGRPHA